MNKDLNRQPCEIYSRVCGWIATQCQNPGKQSERAQMKVYDYEVALEHQFLD